MLVRGVEICHTGLGMMDLGVGLGRCIGSMFPFSRFPNAEVEELWLLSMK
jgi:hypothetical protein